MENINTAVKEYTVTRLSKNNLADLAFLHKEVYGIAAMPGHFNKKYETAFTGTEYVGFIAYNDQQIPVAYYGVIPCFIRYGDKTILAAQSADTMTHPKHRYKGMFVELSNLTFELCRSLNILLVFGFPNQNSYHGAVNKLGWKMTEEMVCFSIPVKALPLQKIAGKIKLLKKIYERYCRKLLSKKMLAVTGIPNSVIKDGFAGILRDDDFLNYKSYSTSKVIRLGEVKAWIQIKNILLLGDIEGVNTTNFNEVINELKRVTAKLGLRQIQFHCSPGTSLYDLFSKNYSATPSYPALFQDFGSAIVPGKIKFTFADIDIF